MQTKHQFYQKGPDNQKRADITIDLKRLDKNKMKDWTVSEKIMAKAFIKRVSGIFDTFKNEILEAIK